MKSGMFRVIFVKYIAQFFLLLSNFFITVSQQRYFLHKVKPVQTQPSKYGLLRGFIWLIYTGREGSSGTEKDVVLTRVFTIRGGGCRTEEVHCSMCDACRLHDNTCTNTFISGDAGVSLQPEKPGKHRRDHWG